MGTHVRVLLALEPFDDDLSGASNHLSCLGVVKSPSVSSVNQIQALEGEGRGSILPFVFGRTKTL